MNTDLSTPLLPDLPEDRLGARKDHLLAEINRQSWANRWLPSSRTRRVQFSFALAAGLAAAAVAATATLGGAASAPSAVARAAGVDDVLAQAQASFGDRLLVSGSVDGSSLTVNLATPSPPSITVGRFEAAVVGLAAADWMQTHGQDALSTVRSVEANGNSLPGAELGDSINVEASVAPLASDACATAAQNAPASLTAVSARTLSLVGGVCVIKVETSDPVAAAQAAPATIPEITS